MRETSYHDFTSRVRVQWVLAGEGVDMAILERNHGVFALKNEIAAHGANAKKESGKTFVERLNNSINSIDPSHFYKGK